MLSPVGELVDPFRLDETQLGRKIRAINPNRFSCRDGYGIASNDHNHRDWVKSKGHALWKEVVVEQLHKSESLEQQHITFERPKIDAFSHIKCGNISAVKRYNKNVMRESFNHSLSFLNIPEIMHKRCQRKKHLVHPRSFP